MDLSEYFKADLKREANPAPITKSQCEKMLRTPPPGMRKPRAEETRERARKRKFEEYNEEDVVEEQPLVDPFSSSAMPKENLFNTALLSGEKTKFKLPQVKQRNQPKRRNLFGTKPKAKSKPKPLIRKLKNDPKETYLQNLASLLDDRAPASYVDGPRDKEHVPIDYHAHAAILKDKLETHILDTGSPEDKTRMLDEVRLDRAYAAAVEAHGHASKRLHEIADKDRYLSQPGATLEKYQIAKGGIILEMKHADKQMKQIRQEAETKGIQLETGEGDNE